MVMAFPASCIPHPRGGQNSDEIVRPPRPWSDPIARAWSMIKVETMERRKASSLLGLAMLALPCSAPVFAQEPHLDTIPVASVDLYGLRMVPDTIARRAFGIPTGVPLPKSTVLDAAIARVDSI